MGRSGWGESASQCPGDAHASGLRTDFEEHGCKCLSRWKQPGQGIGRSPGKSDSVPCTFHTLPPMLCLRCCHFSLISNVCLPFCWLLLESCILNKAHPDLKLSLSGPPPTHPSTPRTPRSSFSLPDPLISWAL